MWTNLCIIIGWVNISVTMEELKKKIRSGTSLHEIMCNSVKENPMLPPNNGQLSALITPSRIS